MKLLVSLLLAAAVACPASSWAQNAPVGVVAVEKHQGKVRGTKALAVQGKIAAIDAEARRLTIVGNAGNELSLIAGPQVKNFAQLKVGDIVTLKFLQSLALELKKGGTALRQRVEGSDSAQAQPGEMPAGAEAHTIQVIADVTAVDKKTGVVTLRGPERTVDLVVRDKSILDQIVVGDQVEATYVEAVAISVHTPKAKK